MNVFLFLVFSMIWFLLVRWCMICRMVFCCVLILDRCIGFLDFRFFFIILVVCCDMLVKILLCRFCEVFFRVMISDLDWILCSSSWMLWLLMLMMFLKMNILFMIFCVMFLLQECRLFIMVVLFLFDMKLRILVVVWILFICCFLRFLLLVSSLVNMLLSLCNVVGCMLFRVVI